MSQTDVKVLCEVPDQRQPFMDPVKRQMMKDRQSLRLGSDILGSLLLKSTAMSCTVLYACHFLPK